MGRAKGLPGEGWAAGRGEGGTPYLWKPEQRARSPSHTNTWALLLALGRSGVLRRPWWVSAQTPGGQVWGSNPAGEERVGQRGPPNKEISQAGADSRPCGVPSSRVALGLLDVP